MIAVFSMISVMMAVPLQTGPPDAVAAKLRIWNARLEPLAREIRISIEHPRQSRYRCDREYCRFREDLSLAAAWPHPSFREPLLKIFRGDDAESVRDAAAGLLAFNDPEFAKLVDKASDDGRTFHRTMCIETSVGYSIRNMLDSRKGEVVVTVPDALSDLASTDPHEAVEAAIWLRSHGIVANADELAEAWPTFADVDRENLVKDHVALRVGRDAWRAAMERAWHFHAKQSAPKKEIVAGLLVELARAESPIGHTEAMKILRADEHLPAGSDDGILRNAAFDALVAAPDANDLPQLLKWVHGNDSRFQWGACMALAALDDQAAADAVGAYVVSSGPNNDLDAVVRNPLSVLRSRDWTSEPARWHFLRAISKALTKKAATASDGFTGENFVIIEMIDTLETMGGTWNGMNGFGSPGMFDAGVARSTAMGWESWIEQNDPQILRSKPQPSKTIPR